MDELPQIISVLTGKISLAGIRLLPREEYQRLPAKLKAIYDEIGPGLLGLQYACKSDSPGIEEFSRTAEEFYRLWKQNKAKAYLAFGKRILQRSGGREMPPEKWQK